MLKNQKNKQTKNEHDQSKNKNINKTIGAKEKKNPKLPNAMKLKIWN